VKRYDHFAIAIPAFDASLSVGQVASAALSYSNRVLVVDDGSSDNTGEVAKIAGAEVVSHAQNLGKGAALRLAFSILITEGFESIVTLDADGQHLPEDIPAIVAECHRGADLVLGSRDHLFDEMAAIRRASNSISSRLISIAAGTNLVDVQTGFRAYSSKLLKVTGFPEHRFDAESAVVVRAVRAGFKIAAVPIRLGYSDGRSTSHYRPLVDSLRIAVAVIRARADSRGTRTRPIPPRFG